MEEQIREGCVRQMCYRITYKVYERKYVSARLSPRSVDIFKVNLNIKKCMPLLYDKDIITTGSDPGFINVQ